VLVCYDFHSGISTKEEDMMFVRKPRLFSIETVVAFTPVRLEELVNLVSSTDLNLVEHVSDALVELVSILHV
jgi:hypothetical protein